jgi:hypothetical protein
MCAYCNPEYSSSNSSSSSTSLKTLYHKKKRLMCKPQDVHCDPIAVIEIRIAY